MKRSILAVSIAAVLAVVGCSAVWLYVRGTDARVLAGKQAVQVLVATKRIPSGTTGAQLQDPNAGFVELVTMPRSTVPDDALNKIDEGLLSLALTADAQPRQLLLRGQFGTPVQHSGGLDLGEGRVAVSVALPVNAGTSFLQPGVKVAIYDTYTMLDPTSRVPAGDGLSRGRADEQVTRLLLPSVQVIAVGGTAPAPSTDSGQTDGVLGDKKSDQSAGGNVSNLVTFAVTQPEAERLIHGAQTGTLYFAVLGETSSLQPGPGVDNSALFN